MPKKKSAGQTPAGADAAAKKTRAAKPKAPAKAPANAKPPANAAPANAARSSATLAIDYPVEGEIVVSPTYAFRITASEPSSVEVSLDRGDWMPARESVGNWWFDWSGYGAGVHTLEARMKTAAGRTVKSKPRQFTVLI